jgi:anion-transporting  ArsA/GET3 family ATPase
MTEVSPPTHLALDIDALIDDPDLRILVCCGSGGVGKTTMSAAIGLRAAERGRRAVVLTIDPARRLAQSMGLVELDNEPRRVPGVDGSAGGSLDAMALDMKRTFDEIVEAHSDPERTAAILANPFYQSLSSSFAGTQEYMAMEKLAQLSRQAQSEGTWDLIIVDTPPSRSALDFLDAPERLGSFLDGQFMRVLIVPARKGGRAGLRVFNAGMGVVSGILDRILGAQVLEDVRTFAGSLDAMFGSFRERADATYRMLKEPGTTFVVISAPEPDALREAAYFVDRLSQDALPLAGLVVNRVHRPRATAITGDAAAAGAERIDSMLATEPAAVDDSLRLTSAMLRLHAEAARRHQREIRLVGRFTGGYDAIPVLLVDALAQDVHDLDALRNVGEMFASGQPT